MLVQLFSPPTPQVLARPWLHPVHPQSSENVIFDKIFFSQDQRVFILEHYFSSRSYEECQNAFRNSFPDSSAKQVYSSTSRRAFPRNREYWWETSFWSSSSSKWWQFTRYQGTFTSVSKKIIKKTFPTNCNDLWIRTKGNKSSQTDNGLRDFWITL
jgi:hypothetical protein